MIDPWGGSYFMESLTESVVPRPRNALIDEVEALGGMTQAIVAGMPKLRIEEARHAAPGAHRPRRGRDRRREQVPARRGGRRSTCATSTTPRCARRRSRRLAAIRARRDGAAVARALGAARASSRARARATCSRPPSRRRARARRSARSPTRSSRSTRATARRCARCRASTAARYQGDDEFDAVRREVEAFAEAEGRRPRMLVVKLGQDGHDRGMKVIATAFADLGFDVDVGPLFQTPDEAARQAIENDVHVVGVSSQAAGHKTLVPELVEALRAQGAPEIAVVVGGIIPPQDYAFLREHGVAAVFGPGTAGAEGRARGARGDRERAAMSARGGMSRAGPSECCAAIRAGDRRAHRDAPSRCSRARAPITRRSARQILEALVPRHGRRGARRHHRARPASARAPSSRRSASTCSGAGQRVAVLAVDPEQPGARGGSILGDKTRMERLAQAERRSSARRPRAGRSAASRSARARRCSCARRPATTS